MKGESRESVIERDRLIDLEAHREWCEAWLARQDVRHPQITQEWVNLLEEVAWAVEEIEDLRVALAALTSEQKP